MRKLILMDRGDLTPSVLSKSSRVVILSEGKPGPEIPGVTRFKGCQLRCSTTRPCDSHNSDALRDEQHTWAVTADALPPHRHGQCAVTTGRMEASEERTGQREVKAGPQFLGFMAESTVF